MKKNQGNPLIAKLFIGLGILAIPMTRITSLSADATLFKVNSVFGHQSTLSQSVILAFDKRLPLWAIGLDA